MKASKLLLYLLLLLLHASAAGQNLLLSGEVVDRFQNKPVPFATIGIKGKGLGTVADETGKFSFNVPTTAVSDEEQVIVSCVGYKNVETTVSAFKQGHLQISLPPAQINLKQVTVKARKVKTRTFGRTGSATLMAANMFTESNLVSDELAKEQGTVIKLDEEVLLRDFNMYVVFNRFKYVKFRLNIYSVSDGLPDQSLLKEDIVFDVTEPKGWVKVDLSKYHIFLEGLDKVAVTIQWLKSEAIEGNRKSFGISAVPVPTHAILFRDKSQGKWKEVSPGHLSFYLTADSYRGRNKSTATETGPEEYVLPDSLKFLRFLSMENPVALSDKNHDGDSLVNGQFVNVNGASLYYETYGQGEPLLLLHGNGQSLSAFSQQIAALSKNFRVIAVDTRAHGKSRDEVTVELTYELFASDMKLLLDSLHLKQVNILGWSDGGNTALKMALNYPVYVKKIAVMGANLFPDETAIESGLLELFNRQLGELKGKEDEQSLNQARRLRLLLKEPHMSFKDMQAIKVPVLVMAGEHDVILESHTRAIAENIKGAKLEIFKDASHYAPQEIPFEFNNTALQFFAPQDTDR
ncbi:pimeloyl-ACP methyl ester carboxylesterase [Pontibacter ummariensis]|uniref:Pimeloyl-ACP methyl ester carboxylesterase n=1 Tax=Pontibacter ummariensis TaxID=1610492 RepID=A0A239IV84_9BACT|nr:alpha/beta fold hydrolase [Pontibacter ummariensis]PRY08977.1 pimeloyl-ACP methyl ester carboxylesterase [Pontibacter ummariensis]SNS97501.1 Pimeloyl-ACP methyl ester carboxylesterase [Pontibacter ummariensis]